MSEKYRKKPVVIEAVKFTGKNHIGLCQRGEQCELKADFEKETK